MKSFCAVLLFVAVASCLTYEDKVAVNRVMRAVMHTVRDARSAFKFDFSEVHHIDKRQTTPSPACQTAYIALLTTFNSTSCSNLGAALSELGNPTVNDTVFAADVTTICTSTCIASIKTAAIAVQTQCPGAQLDSLYDALSSVLVAGRLICTQDSANNYCAPIVRSSLSSLNALNNTEPTPTLLNTVCVPCFQLFLAKMAAFGGANVSQVANVYLAIGLLCSTDTDSTGKVHYCALEFANFVNSANSTTTLAAAIPTVCATHCIGKVFFYLNYISVAAGNGSLDLAAVSKFIDFICLQDNANHYCTQYTLPILENSTSAVCGTAGIQACSQSCGNALYTFATTAPCCLNYMVDLIAVYATQSPAFLYTIISGICQQNGAPAFPTLPKPGTCDAKVTIGSISMNVTLTGATATFFNANTAAVEAAIIADISLTYGVSNTTLSITNVVTNADGSITFTLTYTAQSAADANAIAGEGNSNGSNVFGTNVNAVVPPSGQSDITAGVTYTKVATVFTPATTTPAPATTTGGHAASAVSVVASLFVTLAAVSLFAL